MYYILYLSSLCRRRRWSDPLYEPYQTPSGQYCCTVRVNHREYQADTLHETETMAREHAAMRAYLICRNFSVNDGMLPAGHKGDGTVLQGLPVAIGTGRHSHSTTYDSSSSGSGGYVSGGSSPGSSDSGREDRSRHVSRISRSLAYGSNHR
ncbi:MAG: hypothetical protein M1823_003541 [Watsoniomyces obsoletus]|nr:MAG: hypothetical protein M1823_003541 [Watsoniomyces obsoletus]